MSKTQFTPGPWSVEEDMRSDRVGDMFASDGYREYLAGYNIESGDGEILGCEGIIPSERAEYNAHLIAAAPDLYAALNWALPLARMYMEVIAGDRAKAGHSGLGTKRGTLYDSEVEASEQAIAALAKARGEQS